ncbi:hypothetical protein CSB09_03935 [Candidatus Gracilibacteria bacterium]|nr:MAG: hypothetical protein CSB09_03935 [Candidatus Gracilibacteria bacterium]
MSKLFLKKVLQAYQYQILDFFPFFCVIFNANFGFLYIFCIQKYAHRNEIIPPRFFVFIKKRIPLCILFF